MSIFLSKQDIAKCNPSRLREKLSTVLRVYFPECSDFRGQQYDIVVAAIKDQDIFAVQRTGFGKTICYLLPILSVQQQKITIIISPLISQMRDHIHLLEDKLKVSDARYYLLL